MTVRDLKYAIHQMVEEINDHTVLKAYHEILQQSIKVHLSQTDDAAIPRATLETEIRLAKERVDEGEFISHDNLKSQLENR